MTWRTWFPHTREQAGYRIVQIIGGRRWSLAVYIKPKGWEIGHG